MPQAAQLASLQPCQQTAGTPINRVERAWRVTSQRVLQHARSDCQLHRTPGNPKMTILGKWHAGAGPGYGGDLGCLACRRSGWSAVVSTGVFIVPPLSGS